METVEVVRLQEVFGHGDEEGYDIALKLLVMEDQRHEQIDPSRGQLGDRCYTSRGNSHVIQKPLLVDELTRSHLHIGLK